MELSDILYTVLLAVLPISELRGAIPYAFFKGMSLWGAALLSIAGNMLVQPLFYIFISTFHKLLYVHWSFYQRIFDKTLARARAKVSKQIDKYGYWGLMVFVGIPLPLTGAWTGTLGA
ncbi:MAG: small multi-drug export protein [Sphaerochaetaceae bacterium]